ncbi:helix-turn-helix transcriptional regulator [Salinirubellus sp. GCM10025818]|uniref:helix-turn-helix transcriptional regulator n=1 Tax=Salinirubellus TaxID=2162630 RepID=UPI0030D5255B
MARDARPFPEAALEDVAYLSRSTNRVRILETLTDEPLTRRELMDATGVSRTTLGRILNELAERGWAERRADGRYGATGTGEHVAAAFMPVVDAMATIRSLGGAAAWLPASVHDVGLDAFRDATVHRPDPNAPMSFARELVDRIGGADDVRTLTYLAPPEHSVAEVLHERIRDVDVTSEFVLAGGLTEYLVENPERRERWRESVESGAVVYDYEGYISCNLFVIDGTVLVVNTSTEDGSPGAFLESDHPRVLEWAEDLVASYRADSERLDAEAFA